MDKNKRNEKKKLHLFEQVEEWVEKIKKLC